MFALLFSLCALASNTHHQTWAPRPLAGRAVIDLRAGVSAVAQPDSGVHPYLCGEVSPIAVVSVEACGNGSGILHQAEGPDMAHFRARAVALKRSWGRVDASLLGGVGFMEVQRNSDAPGFRFGAAESGQVEAAGPEASIGVKGRVWMHAQSYLVIDATVGVAHVEGAPEVMGWQSASVPFGGVTMGMGF